MVDILEFKKDFKKYCEIAESSLKVDKYNEAINYFKKSITCLENLLKFDENHYNIPVYIDKKKKLSKK